VGSIPPFVEMQVRFGRQPIYYMKTNVVPIAGVFASRIAQTNN